MDSKYKIAEWRKIPNALKTWLISESDLIFNVPQLISFLSRGTTLPAGTTIVTGTPAGVAMSTNQFLKDGEEFAVEVLPHIGTLVNIFELQKERPSL
jgi:2-keto-4-pentenoate hydratase/2-oxohepta-3-ene-1,7-dioic acid hydratase in catechol pathway